MQYSGARPASSSHSASRIWRCNCASCATSDSRRNQRIVGMAAHDARQLQGASSKMASKGFHRTATATSPEIFDASATSTCADKPSRASVSWMRALRFSSTSSAVTCGGGPAGACSSRCAVFATRRSAGIRSHADRVDLRQIQPTCRTRRGLLSRQQRPVRWPAVQQTRQHLRGSVLYQLQALGAAPAPWLPN